MGELISAKTAIATMSPSAIKWAADVEGEMRASVAPVTLKMKHVLHAGMYSRAVLVPSGITIVGVLIKIPTIVIIQGDVTAWMTDGPSRIKGYAVLPASAGRKQVFHAHEDTFITMIFPSRARTVAEAEREFTDDVDSLAACDAETIITEE